jgi:hypothetical protein
MMLVYGHRSTRIYLYRAQPCIICARLDQSLVKERRMKPALRTYLAISICAGPRLLTQHDI